MPINNSSYLTFIHSLKEQSLSILEEQITANKNNNKELLKLMMSFVYTYYKKSDHTTLEDKKSCQKVMRLIEAYQPQGTVEDLEEVYVLYSQLIQDIEWGIECTHWEPLGNDKTINPSLDKMNERKKALETRLQVSSQIPDEKLATIDLAALAKKISSSSSTNLEEFYLFVHAYYYNHSSGEPANEEEINKAYHASLYKILNYTLKSMKEYRAYNYLLHLIDFAGEEQQHCPLTYFHSINPELASAASISIDDALTLKYKKLRARANEFDSTMYLACFEGSFQNKNDFKLLCTDIEQFKTKFNNALIAAQLYHSTYFRMKNSNIALTGTNVVDTINRFLKVLPPASNIRDASPQWNYYNKQLALLQSKCEKILGTIDTNSNKDDYLAKKDLKNAILLADFFKEIDLQYVPEQYQSHEQYIQFTRTKSILLKIFSSQHNKINIPLRNIIEQSSSPSELELIKEFFDLFRSSSNNESTYSIQNYLDKLPNIQDLFVSNAQREKIIERLLLLDTKLEESLSQFCKQIDLNIADKNYDVVFEGKPADYDSTLQALRWAHLCSLGFTLQTKQTIKKTLEQNSSFKRYIQYDGISEEVACTMVQHLNQVVRRTKQQVSEFKKMLAGLGEGCLPLRIDFRSPDVNKDYQEIIQDYFNRFLNHILASSKNNSLKITLDRFFTVIKFSQEHKVTIDFQPLLTSIFNQEQIKDITSIEDIERFINTYKRNNLCISFLPSPVQKVVQEFYDKLQQRANWLNNISVDEMLQEVRLVKQRHVGSQFYQRLVDVLELYKRENHKFRPFSHKPYFLQRNVNHFMDDTSSSIRRELYLKIKTILKLDNETISGRMEKGILSEADTFLSPLINYDQTYFSTLQEFEAHILKQVDCLIDNQKLIRRLMKNPEFPMKELLGFFNNYSGDPKTLGVIRHILSLSGNFPKERFVTEILTNPRNFQIFVQNIQLVEFFAFNQRPEPEYSLESIVMKQIFVEQQVRKLKQQLQRVLDKNLGINETCIIQRDFGQVHIGNKVVTLPGLKGLNLVTTEDVHNDFRYFVYLRFGILSTLLFYLEQKSDGESKDFQIDYKHKLYNRVSTIKQYLNSPHAFDNCGSVKKEIGYVPEEILKALGLNSMSDDRSPLRGHISFLPGIRGKFFDNKDKVYILGTELEVLHMLNFVLDVLPLQEEVNCDVENCRSLILDQCYEVLNGNVTAASAFENVLTGVLTYLNQRRSHYNALSPDDLSRNAWNIYKDLVTRLCNDPDKLMSFTQTFNNEAVHAPIDSELIKSKYFNEYNNKNGRLYRSTNHSQQTGRSSNSRNDIAKPTAPKAPLHATGNSVTTGHSTDHTGQDCWYYHGHNNIPAEKAVPQRNYLPSQSANVGAKINSEGTDYFSSAMEYKLACYFSPYLRKQSNLTRTVDQLLVSQTFSFDADDITEIDQRMSEFANAQASSVLAMYNQQFLEKIESRIPDDNEKKQMMANILHVKSTEFFTTNQELLTQSDEQKVQEKSEQNIYQFFSPKQEIATHSFPEHRFTARR